MPIGKSKDVEVLQICSEVYESAGEIISPWFHHEIPFEFKRTLRRIWDDADRFRPQVFAQNRTKQTGAWHFLVKLPPGKVSFEDFKAKEGMFKDACGGEEAFVEVERKGKAVRVSVYPSSLMPGGKYAFPWDFYDHLTEKQRKYAIPVFLGYRIGDIPVVIDLNTLPHLLVGGATGMGKSGAIHCILNSLLLLPAELRPLIIVIDLKVVEYTYAMDAIKLCDSEETGARALLALELEMKRRQQLFKQYRGCVNLASYNKHVEEKLPYVVCIIDEIAEFEEDADSQRRLAKLARLARSVGISLICCTQKPEADIFPHVKFTRMRNNFVGRLCLPVVDKANSEIILASPIGAELPSIPGRAIYRKGRKFVEVQFPYFNPAVDGIEHMPGNGKEVNVTNESSAPIRLPPGS